MAEPRYLEGDDFALGINQPCDSCDNKECSCDDGTPDRMWGDED
jgi:hypothetical protein